MSCPQGQKKLTEVQRCEINVNDPSACNSTYSRPSNYGYTSDTSQTYRCRFDHGVRKTCRLAYIHSGQRGESRSCIREAQAPQTDGTICGKIDTYSTCPANDVVLQDTQDCRSITNKNTCNISYKSITKNQEARCHWIDSDNKCEQSFDFPTSITCDALCAKNYDTSVNVCQSKDLIYLNYTPDPCINIKDQNTCNTSYTDTIAADDAKKVRFFPGYRCAWNPINNSCKTINNEITYDGEGGVKYFDGFACGVKMCGDNTDESCNECLNYTSSVENKPKTCTNTTVNNNSLNPNNYQCCNRYCYSGKSNNYTCINSVTEKTTTTTADVKNKNEYLQSKGYIKPWLISQQCASKLGPTTTTQDVLDIKTLGACSPKQQSNGAIQCSNWNNTGRTYTIWNDRTFNQLTGEARANVIRKGLGKNAFECINPSGNINCQYFSYDQNTGRPNSKLINDCNETCYSGKRGTYKNRDGYTLNICTPLQQSTQSFITCPNWQYGSNMDKTAVNGPVKVILSDQDFKHSKGDERANIIQEGLGINAFECANPDGDINCQAYGGQVYNDGCDKPMTFVDNLNFLDNFTNVQPYNSDSISHFANTYDFLNSEKVGVLKPDSSTKTESSTETKTSTDSNL